MDDLLPDFDNYTMKIIMPGKLISSTGFADSTGLLLWPVKSDFFLTSDYEMKVESRIINYWALIITGVFLLFVISGLIYRRAGK
jgi:hypothetical protein